MDEIDLHKHFEGLGEAATRLPEAHKKRNEHLDVFKSNELAPEAIYMFHRMIEQKSPNLDKLIAHLSKSHGIGKIIEKMKQEYHASIHGAES